MMETNYPANDNGKVDVDLLLWALIQRYGDE